MSLLSWTETCPQGQHGFAPAQRWHGHMGRCRNRGSHRSLPGQNDVALWHMWVRKGQTFSSCWSMGNTCGRRWPCGMPWAPFLINQEEGNRQGQKVGGTSWYFEEKGLNNLGGLTPVLVPFVGLVAPALSTCWPVGLLMTQPSSSSSTSRPWVQGGGAV